MSAMSASMNVSTGDFSQASHRKTELKSFLETVTNLEEQNDDNIQTIKITTEILTKVDTLYQEVGTDHRNLGESYLDSQVLCATSCLAIRCAELVSGNINDYDRHELAEHISSNPDFWEFKLPYEAPPVSYLHGAFDPTPPEKRPKAPRKRVERQAPAALKVPDNVASIDKKDGPTEMVTKVHTFVKEACRSGPLCYFRVALDPTSFTRSVENIYYLSFLARDGRLEVFIDSQTGLPRIKTRPPEEQDKNKENHFIASIDMKLWRELIKALNIKKTNDGDREEWTNQKIICDFLGNVQIII